MSAATASAQDIVARALAYPFGVPEGSYALDGGEAGPLTEADLAAADRVAVLAYGANASPGALAAKLGPGVSRVAVVAGQLRDFDVVYSAHVSPHGAIPGTLQPCPGAVASVHAIHVTAEQLARLHRSEPNYVFGRLHEVDLHLEGGGRADAIHAYVSRHGCLVRDGAPVGVAAIPVRRRAWPEREEDAVLCAARDDLDPGTDLADFVLAHVADPELAARRTATLRATAIPFAWPHWEPA
ncbi:MAG: hypothetical protein QOJ97_2324 [Solirubrobacteraceae bacterium]|jgi:hypothetical protein|nr:hypothetical protein [Solirubrobacteraceae bacterium]